MLHRGWLVSVVRPRWTPGPGGRGREQAHRRSGTLVVVQTSRNSFVEVHAHGSCIAFQKSYNHQEIGRVALKEHSPHLIFD